MACLIVHCCFDIILLHMRTEVVLHLLQSFICKACTAIFIVPILAPKCHAAYKWHILFFIAFYISSTSTCNPFLRSAKNIYQFSTCVFSHPLSCYFSNLDVSWCVSFLAGLSPQQSVCGASQKGGGWCHQTNWLAKLEALWQHGSNAMLP